MKVPSSRYFHNSFNPHTSNKAEGISSGLLVGSKITTVLASMLIASSAFAAGFQIQEQSTSFLGTAYSGTAATAWDATTAYYNPAGMTRIKGKQFVLSGIVITADSDFEVSSAGGSLLSASSGTNTPVTSFAEADPGQTSPVPAFHYTAQVMDSVWLGLSIAPPFGLETNYSENSIARYMATRSELRTIDISPSVAVKVMEPLSIAVGADFVYAKAHLDAQIGTGNRNDVDGFQRNQADAWGYGWHLGMLWEYSPTTRFGINYRSLVEFDAKGDSEQLTPMILISREGPPVFFPSEAIHTSVGVEAEVTLPETIYASLYHEFNENWAVLADVQWTHWERFKTLRLRYDTTNQGLQGLRQDSDTHENWEDTWRVAVGGLYMPCDKWMVRAGVAWDQSPVDDDNRTARVPDSDRIWVGVGAGFALAKSVWLDIGYAHLFFEEAELHDHAPFVAQTTSPVSRAYLNGEYDKSSADIFGVQIRWTFV